MILFQVSVVDSWVGNEAMKKNEFFFFEIKTVALKLCKATDFWFRISWLFILFNSVLWSQKFPLAAQSRAFPNLTHVLFVLIFWLTCRSVKREVKNNGCFSWTEIKRMLPENRNNLISFILFLILACSTIQWNLWRDVLLISKKETFFCFQIEYNFPHSLFWWICYCWGGKIEIK